jgi:hypothetical protein
MSRVHKILADGLLQHHPQRLIIPVGVEDKANPFRERLKTGRAHTTPDLRLKSRTKSRLDFQLTLTSSGPEFMLVNGG